IMRDAELSGTLLDKPHEVGGRDFLLPAPLALGVERHFEELHRSNARYLDRILKGQEHALGGALIGLHCEEILALIEHLALRDFVAFAAREHIGQGRFAGAIRAHDGVDLARLYRERYAIEDRAILIRELHMQVLDFKHSSCLSS